MVDKLGRFSSISIFLAFRLIGLFVSSLCLSVSGLDDYSNTSPPPFGGASLSKLKRANIELAAASDGGRGKLAFAKVANVAATRLDGVRPAPSLKQIPHLVGQFSLFFAREARHDVCFARRPFIANWSESISPWLERVLQTLAASERPYEPVEHLRVKCTFSSPLRPNKAIECRLAN